MQSWGHSTCMWFLLAKPQPWGAGGSISLQPPRGASASPPLSFSPRKPPPEGWLFPPSRWAVTAPSHGSVLSAPAKPRSGCLMKCQLLGGRSAASPEGADSLTAESYTRLRTGVCLHWRSVCHRAYCQNQCVRMCVCTHTCSSLFSWLRLCKVPTMSPISRVTVSETPDLLSSGVSICNMGT